MIFIFIFNFILKMRRQIREIDRDAFDRKIEKIHVDLDRREETDFDEVLAFRADDSGGKRDSSGGVETATRQFVGESRVTQTRDDGTIFGNGQE